MNHSAGVSHSLIGLVDVVNGDDGQVAIVTEIAQSDARTSLDFRLFDDLLCDIQADRHAEEITICETDVLHDAGASQIDARSTCK